MTGYNAVIAGTGEIYDPSRTVKIYFLENLARNKPWNGELDVMRKGFAASPFLKRGIATVVSFSDKETGISKIFYHNPKMHYLNNGPLAIKNSDLTIAEGYELKDSIVVSGVKIPEMTCWAEQQLVCFGQTILCKEGLEAFKEEWSPHNILEWKKPEPVV